MSEPAMTVCTMCEDAPATTTYVAPVCQPCHDWLVELGGELDAMEEADPALGKAAGEVADAARAFLRSPHGRKP